MDERIAATGFHYRLTSSSAATGDVPCLQTAMISEVSTAAVLDPVYLQGHSLAGVDPIGVKDSALCEYPFRVSPFLASFFP